MKRNVAITLVTTAAIAAISLGCFAGCSKKKEASQIASAKLFRNDHAVETTVDLSDGYSCEFTQGAVYVYDQEKNEDIPEVAIGIALSEKSYNDCLEMAQNDKHSKEINDGIMYTDGYSMIYVCKVGDDAFFGIFAEDVNAAEMQDIINRISTSPEC